MTLDEIIIQSDELLHNGLENSPTDALRLVNHLARWIYENRKATDERFMVIFRHIDAMEARK